MVAGAGLAWSSLGHSDAITRVLTDNINKSAQFIGNATHILARVGTRALRVFFIFLGEFKLSFPRVKCSNYNTAYRLGIKATLSVDITPRALEKEIIIAQTATNNNLCSEVQRPYYSFDYYRRQRAFMKYDLINSSLNYLLSIEGSIFCNFMIMVLEFYNCITHTY